MSERLTFCLICGREFRPRDANTAFCPACGGPPEAPAPDQPVGTVLVSQASGRGAIAGIPSAGAETETHRCLICGREFRPRDANTAFCPACGGPPEAPAPDQPVGTVLVSQASGPRAIAAIPSAGAETEIHRCIICGREFRPRDANTAFCPACGGPPEAPAPDQSIGTVLVGQASGRGAIAGIPSAGAETETHRCLICGREFRPRDANTAFCPACGGPPEAPARDQPVGTVLVSQASGRGAIAGIPSAGAETEIHRCIICGREFRPRDANTAFCPACGGPPEAPAPDQPVGTVLVSEPKPGVGAPSRPQGTVSTGEPTISTTETDVPLEWKEGYVIDGLYRVWGKNTSGAMGVIYFVEHLGWKTNLAVKVPRIREGDERALKAFLREAETWVNLGLHPHIAACYYVREMGGLPRIFVEYVSGGSLRDALAEQRLRDLKDVLDIAIQFCRGMDYAHRKGLVHRDIKPGNCLLERDGTLKVSDFGLTKALGSVGEEAAAGILTSQFAGSVSLFGGVAGTPEYMAPEQFKGQAGFAADIYAFGVVLYEMVAGARPFVVSDDVLPEARVYFYQDLHQTQQPTDPRQWNPDCPEELSRLILRCLEKEPQARPQRFAEIEQALLGMYQARFGEYPRPAVAESTLVASDLNNRAISMLDLGREAEAEGFLREALQADPAHPEAVYNLALLEWRAGRIDDLKAVERMEAVFTGRPGDWLPAFLLASLHLERGDNEAALAALEAGKDAPPEVEELRASARNSPGIRCLRTLEGGGWFVCFSPDGRLALSGGGDKTLRLWDVQTGECLRTLEGHDGTVYSVCFSPDGRLALSGSGDATLRLWDLQTGECLRTLEGHRSTVTSVCFSPDGRRALSGSWDHTLRLWDVQTGRCLRTLEGHKDPVTSVCFSPDGRLALSGSWDKTLRLWDLQTGECLRTLEGHKGWVTSVCFSPDGRLALSGSVDKTLRLWDVQTGECLRTLEGHKDPVTSVCFSPDGRLALSGSHDDTLRLWDLQTGECLRTLEGHKGRVHSVCFSPDGRLVLSGSWIGTLRLWNLERGRKAFFRLAEPVSTGQFLLDQSRFQTLIQDARAALGVSPVRSLRAAREARSLPGFERSREALALWFALYRRLPRRSLQSAWLDRVLEGHKWPVRSVCFSPDGRLALSGSGDDTLRLWDLQTGECLRTLEGHKWSVYSVCFGPDGRLALSGGMDKTIRLWDVQTGECLRTLEGHEDDVNSVCFSPDGRRALSGSEDNTLRLWDVQTGRCLRTLEGHEDDVNSVCFSPDGRFALSGSWDATLRLWDVQTGRCLRTLEGHKSTLNSVCFSPDGRRALSGSLDHTLRLWDLQTGECLRTLEGHKEWVESVCFSPDGRFALSGSKDKTLRLWDLQTGECLRTQEGHEGSVLSVCFSPDGRLALSGSEDKTLRLWVFDWELEEKEPADWDEGARPYLDIFLTLHPPYRPHWLLRRGAPRWTEEDFQQLLTELGYRGYGWLRPEGVRRELEKMARERGWKGG